ncbi:HyaD/HybD family hydrogenase maturation endopeptidase [Methyloversatilis thermotolerans]|uniref:HyaD/HybD family hydrogenase maturation endopeptidase n=1 Tax=Methyloversatilis thermotolerans TaxID=1346290 RepID=UPI0003633CD1|nr:HyaD/HybD family hydrogenase maturation endopeptidase [Methyloversatilis thermotolerans]
MRIHPSGIACHPGGDSIVVLGIGNVLWADEGFGVRCVEALQQGWELGAEGTSAGDAIDSAAGGPDVQLIDGGTQGLYLVQHVQAADRLLIFDAIDYGLAPGSLRCIVDDEVPRFMGAKKMSLHQTGFQEVLMLAQLTGRYPREVLLIGCQPAVLEDYGGSLSAPVRQAMDEALRLGLAALARWGARPRVRRTPLTERERITFAELDLARYEADRPPADAACRHGDERFMPGGR